MRRNLVESAELSLLAMSATKRSSLIDVESSPPEKSLDVTPSLEQSYIESGLSPDDAYFLANVSEEIRKKCIRKVSTNCFHS